jgi:hypothetical protein
MIFLVHSDCSAPTLEFNPPSTPLFSPLVYRRSQAFSITSTVQHRCPSTSASMLLRRQWSLMRCSNSICSSSSFIFNNTTIDLRSNDLYLPPRTLPYGRFQLTLTVQSFNESLLHSSASTHVEIIASPIRPQLLSTSTTLVTKAYGEELLFEPGRAFQSIQIKIDSTHQ